MRYRAGLTLDHPHPVQKRRETLEIHCSTCRDIEMSLMIILIPSPTHTPLTTLTPSLTPPSLTHTPFLLLLLSFTLSSSLTLSHSLPHSHSLSYSYSLPPSFAHSHSLFYSHILPLTHTPFRRQLDDCTKISLQFLKFTN